MIKSLLTAESRSSMSDQAAGEGMLSAVKRGRIGTDVEQIISRLSRCRGRRVGRVWCLLFRRILRGRVGGLMRKGRMRV